MKLAPSGNSNRQPACSIHATLSSRRSSVSEILSAEEVVNVCS